MSVLSTQSVNIENLRELSQRILCAYGVSQKDAGLVVESLLDAEIRGITSHGMMRLSSYAERIRKGMISTEPNIQIAEVGNLLQVDGDNGLGQVITMQALERCMDKADEQGSAVAVIRNSNHFGTAGFYSRLAAQRGYVAFVSSNASPNMPPFGGIDPMLGTNPFAVSFPAGKYDNFTIDIAMSAVAKGKIRIFEKEGREIPLGWAMDTEGNDTTDAQQAILGGLLPMGGHKGYGLAMVVDLLCAVLSGAKLSYESESMFASKSVAGTGHFLWLLRIDKLMPEDEFVQRVEQWFDQLKSSRTRPGVQKIFIPGEIENQRAAQVEENLEISTKTLEAIKLCMS